MKIRTLIHVGMLSIVPTLLFSQAPTEAEDQATIAVTGRAMRSVQPDRAMMYVAIESAAGTAAEASTVNAGKLNRVIDEIVADGIERDRLEVSAYDVGPSYDYAEFRRDLVDFRANAIVRVPVTDLGQLGTLVDKVLGAGATEIRRIVFSSDTQRSVRDEVLREAVGVARAEAEAVAVGLGVELGDLISVNVGRDWWEPEFEDISMELAPMRVARGAQVRVTASVTTKWQIGSGR